MIKSMKDSHVAEIQSDIRQRTDDNQKKKSSQASKSYVSAIKKAVSSGLIKAAGITSESDITEESIKDKVFSISGGPLALKYFLRQSIPYITIGTENSNILGANISSTKHI